MAAKAALLQEKEGVSDGWTSFGNIPGNDSTGNFIDGVTDMDCMAVKVDSFPFESQNLTPAQPQKQGQRDWKLNFASLNSSK